jgi:hypothetical protein
MEQWVAFVERLVEAANKITPSAIALLALLLALSVVWLR